jgi:type IX secretion system PorP/SprF family membrane protein
MNKHTIPTMKKLFISVVVAGSLVSSGFAQQLPFYSQSYFNPFLYNPAATGVSGETNAFLLHRSQFSGISGGPVTNAFTVDGFMDDKNIGLGLSIFNDVQDINERLGIYTSYAYRLKLNDDMQLRFGLSLGFLDNRIDFSKAIVKDNSDPMMFSQLQRRSGLDGNIGVSFNWKDLRVGVSVPQLFGQRMEFSNYDTRAYYQLNRHYLGTVSYKYVVSETQQIALEPMAMVRYLPNTPIQYDINMMASWKDMIWLGASYRSNYAVGVNARLKLFGNLSAGYAYDILISPLKTSAGISHEFMLGYRFGQMQSGASTGGAFQRGKYD